jgi:uncharacterized protein YqgV (UPF0045/DUF77 family)
VDVLEDILAEFEKKVDKSLTEVLDKYDINYQIEEANTVLMSQWDAIEGMN